MEFLTLAKYYSSYSTNGLDSLFTGLGIFFGMFIGIIIVSLALVILIYAAYWGILKKAGKEFEDVYQRKQALWPLVPKYFLKIESVCT